MTYPSSQYKIQFEQVYISYFAKMKRFAQEYVVREEDAENIVQDIFFELLEKKYDLFSITNLNGFLFVMLKNRCIDFIRHKTMEKQILDNIKNDYNLNLKLKLASLSELNDRLLSEIEIDTKIHQAIDNLPESCKNIFIMNKFEGKKQKEIANTLKISIHTVESQMAIAYRKLRVALKESISFFNLLFF